MLIISSNWPGLLLGHMAWSINGFPAWTSKNGELQTAAIVEKVAAKWEESPQQLLLTVMVTEETFPLLFLLLPVFSFHFSSLGQARTICKTFNTRGTHNEMTTPSFLIVAWLLLLCSSFSTSAAVSLSRPERRGSIHRGSAFELAPNVSKQTNATIQWRCHFSILNFIHLCTA